MLILRVANLEPQQLVDIGDLYKTYLIFDVFFPFLDLPMFSRAFIANRLMLPHKRIDLTLKIILYHSCNIFLNHSITTSLIFFDLLLDNSNPLCALILLSLYLVISPQLIKLLVLPDKSILFITIARSKLDNVLLVVQWIFVIDLWGLLKRRLGNVSMLSSHFFIL